MNTKWTGMFLINAIFVSLVFAIPAWGSDDYPSKPIRIFPAFKGGGLDVSSRLISEKMAQYLGQPVLVENKAGGGGALATAYVAASKPDGYTLVSVPPTHVSLPLTTRDLPYKMSDLIPVGRFVTFHQYIMVNKDSPFRTLDDLVGYGKKHPGTLSYSTSGFGGNTYLIMEILKLDHHIDLQFVPFPGGELPAATALAGNNIQVAALGLASSHALIRSGAIRPLAVLSTVRDPAYPQVPTTVEQGYTDLINVGYYMLLAPAKTPSQVLSKLESALERACQDKGVQEAISKMNSIADFQNSRDSQAMLDRDVKRWSQIVKRVGIVSK